MADLLASIRAEIDVRLGELRPALAEYEELLSVLDALGSDGRSASAQSVSSPAGGGLAQSTAAPARTRSPRPPRTRRPPARRPRRRERPGHGPAGQAILAALEHGSHTVAELVLVTALPAPDIRAGARRLLESGAISKTEREGRSAYALRSPGA
jgi:hypothetical protein